MIYLRAVRPLLCCADRQYGASESRQIYCTFTSPHLHAGSLFDRSLPSWTWKWRVPYTSTNSPHCATFYSKTHLHSHLRERFKCDINLLMKTLVCCYLYRLNVQYMRIGTESRRVRLRSSWRWLWRLSSSGIQHRVFWQRFTDVSVERRCYLSIGCSTYL
jgi:hypothetical protein